MTIRFFKGRNSCSLAFGIMHLRPDLRILKITTVRRGQTDRHTEKRMLYYLDDVEYMCCTMLNIIERPLCRMMFLVTSSSFLLHTEVFHCSSLLLTCFFLKNCRAGLFTFIHLSQLEVSKEGARLVYNKATGQSFFWCLQLWEMN